MPRKHKVLVADDSLTIRKMVEMLLLQEGYEVVLAETGAKCLALCASSPPDVVVLDFMLPDMPAVEVCQALMNSPNVWSTPVLLMSGNGHAIRQLYQDINNVADYLTKPFPPNVLKAVVADILHRNRVRTKTAGLPSAEPASGPGGCQAGQHETDLVSAPQTGTPATQQAPEALIARFREVLRKHWHHAWQQIPSWERNRGSEPPETYYADLFLADPACQDLGLELLGLFPSIYRPDKSSPEPRLLENDPQAQAPTAVAPSPEPKRQAA